MCTTWLLDKEDYYLIDLLRGRFEYPELKRRAVLLAEQHKPKNILIEDASTRAALAQELRPICRSAIRLIPVEHDKVGRLYVQQAKFESGRVLFPRQAPWLPELLAELLSFPHGKHDDQVDSISQALGVKRSGYDSTMSWVE